MRAGLAKVELSAAATGAELMGYPDRAGPATGVHDALYARALVLESEGRRLALCSVDLCAVNEDVVAAARARAAGDLFVSATHTHSAPHDDDPPGLAARIAEAVEEAAERLAPARIGAGWGALHGPAVNRRRREDPVDPAVFVLRIDAAGGAPLGVLYGYACHPVVLGPDNREVSADWPGAASRVLEEALGGVAVFAQGACGDVNPLTDNADVYDRRGGTFAQAERLGRAVAGEVLRVHRSVACGDGGALWTRTLAVECGAAVGGGPLGGHGVPRADGPLEVMLAGIDGPGVVLAGQPGEVFSETGAALRRTLRAAGVRHPFVVGYANGWRAYLAPASAYADGGYEVEWAQAMGLPQDLQDEIESLVKETLQR